MVSTTSRLGSFNTGKRSMLTRTCAIENFTCFYLCRFFYGKGCPIGGRAPKMPICARTASTGAMKRPHKAIRGIFREVGGSCRATISLFRTTNMTRTGPAGISLCIACNL